MRSTRRHGLMANCADERRRRPVPARHAPPPTAALVVGGCRLDELGRAFGTPALRRRRGRLRATGARDARRASRRAAPGRASLRLEGVPLHGGVRGDGGGGTRGRRRGRRRDHDGPRGRRRPVALVLHGNAKTDAEISACRRGRRGPRRRRQRRRRRPARAHPRAGSRRVLVRIIPEVRAETHARWPPARPDGSSAADDRRRRADRPPRTRARGCGCDGVHVHVGSQILDVDAVRRRRRAPIAAAGRVPRLRPRRRARARATRTTTRPADARRLPRRASVARPPSTCRRAPR